MPNIQSLPLIEGKNLTAGTYICGLTGGGIEYGYTFSKPDPSDPSGEPMEDVEFDIVLGVVPRSVADAGPVIEEGLRKFRWAAEAIVKAAPLPTTNGVELMPHITCPECGKYVDLPPEYLP